MGCDIHFHSEVKIGGKWHHHSEHSIRRNYALFAKMAGVRNYDDSIIPISKPKGIPQDATDLTKLHVKRWEGDGHSHSWLNAEEITELHDWIRERKNGSVFGDDGWRFEHQNFPYFMGNHLSGFHKYPEDYKGTGVEDVRYIFFFDN